MHEIDVKPSRLLGLFALGIAILALVAVHHAAVPSAAQWALDVVVLGALGWQWRARGQGARLRVMPDGGLQCRSAAGAWQDLEVEGESFVTPVLVVLRYRIEGGRAQRLAILPDSASSEALRRLRVSLRWSRRTRSDTGSRDAG